MTSKLSCIAIATLVGCTGTVDGLSGPGSGSDSGSGTLTPPDCATRGPRMMRRLTNAQVRNTLVAAFMDPGVPVQDVLTDPVVLGFKVDATQAVVRDLDAQLIMTNAEAIADWAVTQKLGQLTTCQTTDAACTRPMIQTIGQRLYREPLSAELVDGYAQMFAAEATFADGARVVISTMLQSPYFLYRRELGTHGDDGVYHLTPYEVASSLSYMATNGPPDATLMAAASQGKLTTRADLDREVARLIATPEADTAFGSFTRSWLMIDDLLDRVKLDPTNQLTPALRTSMLEETQLVFMNVLRSGAKASELFTASYTFLDQALASYYQLGGGGAGFQRVDLPANTRGHGLLGNGSILTRHALADSSSPVQRGKLVRERLLCQELPPPPPNVNANLPPPMGAMTTRQRYEQHMQGAACMSCHTRIDPVGFAFEHFDAFGRKRDQENGIAIDATGKLVGMPDGDIALDGLDSLSTYLAGSQPVSQCLVRFLSYSAYGLDHCSVSDITTEVTGSDGSLKSMILAIVRAPQFTTRAE